MAIGCRVDCTYLISALVNQWRQELLYDIPMTGVQLQMLH